MPRRSFGGGGGGSGVGAPDAGAVRVLSFPFAFDTPGIEDGVEVWTPADGDVLLDAWFFVTTAFNGTTPKLDIGTFVGNVNGLFYWSFGVADCDTVDSDGGAGTGVRVANRDGRSLSSISNTPGGQTFFAWQAGFTATNPLKLVVSQDGAAGGAAIGGTTGAGTLYLVVASPTLSAP